MIRLQNQGTMDRDLVIEPVGPQAPRSVMFAISEEGRTPQGLTVDYYDVLAAVVKAVPEYRVAVLENVPGIGSTRLVHLYSTPDGLQLAYRDKVVTIEMAETYAADWAGIAYTLREEEQAEVKRAEEREARIVKLGRAMEVADGVAMDVLHPSVVGDKYRKAAEGALAALEASPFAPPQPVDGQCGHPGCLERVRKGPAGWGHLDTHGVTIEHDAAPPVADYTDGGAC